MLSESKNKASGSKPKTEAKKIQVDIDDQTAQGQYANLALSNFSKEECVLDFAFLQPNIGKAKIRSRVILSPNNAKKLVLMLQANLKTYEKKHGPLSDAPAETKIRFSAN